MTPSPPQIEAEAREALLYAREACARSLELRDQMEVANEFRIGQYDGLPDIQMRVAAYLAGRSAALSPQPTSQDDAQLIVDLQVHAFDDCNGRDVPTHIANVAAARIATLSADVARMREALELLPDAHEAIIASNEYIPALQAYVEATEQFLVTQDGELCGLMADRDQRGFKKAWARWIAAREGVLAIQGSAHAALLGETK